MSLEYYPELEEIRAMLEASVHGFPRSCCNIAARVVHEALGLQQIAGTYLPTGTWHAWNYDYRRGLYIDLTQDQFDPAIPKIRILPRDTDILLPEAVLQMDHLAPVVEEIVRRLSFASQPKNL